MIIDLPPKVVASHDFSDIVSDHASQTGGYESDFQIDDGFFDRYELGQSIVSPDGGKTLIRFIDRPMLRLNFGRGMIEVEGWGVEVPISKSTEVPRELARKFLQLWSRSEKQILNPEDRASWEFIVDTVDFDSFTVDRVAPRYVEALYVRQNNQQRPVVKWQDGTLEEISKECSGSLAVLNPGEWFGGYAKFGTDGRTIHLERIFMLEGRDEPLPREWPTRL